MSKKPYPFQLTRKAFGGFKIIIMSIMLVFSIVLLNNYFGWSEKLLNNHQEILVTPLKTGPYSGKEIPLGNIEKREIGTTVEKVLDREDLVEDFVETRIIKYGNSQKEGFVEFQGPLALYLASVYKEGVKGVGGTNVYSYKLDDNRGVVQTSPLDKKELVYNQDDDGSSVIGDDCFEVEPYNTGVSITSYDKSCGIRIEIPEKISDKDVLAIKDSERSDEKEKFIGVFMEKGIETVKMPSNLQRIGNNAFEDNALRSVELNEGLKEIGIMAFANNSLITDVGENQLVHITLPNSLELVDEGAFYNNTLETVVVDDPQINIGTFYDNHITNIELKSGITLLASEVFDDQETKEGEEIHNFSYYYSGEKGKWYWNNNIRTTK